MLPKLTALAQIHQKINFYKLDVDEHAQLTQEAGARIYPTFIVYRRGTKVRFIPPVNATNCPDLFLFSRSRPSLAPIQVA